MVSRLFETAGTLLDSVSEVLAPTVKTPLESFKNHWKVIRYFYIDEKYDVESFQASALPEHLVSMVTILLEEEREENRRTKKDAFQPCLEFFMQDKMMETFCILAEKDIPIGTRKLVLQLIATLLGDMPHSILPNMSVHRPIGNLIQSCTNQDLLPTEKSEFVNLLNTIVALLERDPSLAGFFFESVGNANSNNVSVFVIVPALIQHLADEGVAGDKARDTVLHLVTLADKSTEVTSYIVKHSQLVDKIIAQVIFQYKQLPPIGNQGFVNSSPQFQKYKAWLRFVNQIIKKTRNAITEQVVQKLDEDFLTCVVGPSLLQPYVLKNSAIIIRDETIAVTSTIYFRETIRIIDQEHDNNGIFLNLVILFILGDFDAPETEEDESDHMLRATLLHRINSSHEQLSYWTLKLFETLIGLNNQHVMYNLIFRTLIPRFHELSTAHSPEANLDNIQSSLSSLLTLVLESDFGSSSSSYQAYQADVQQQTRACKDECLKWQQNSRLLLSDKIPKYDIIHFTNPGILSSDETCVEKFYGGGLFLTMLLNKMETLLSQTLDTNLVLTGMFSRLAQYPYPLLYLFLLQKILPLRNGIRSLWIVLEKASQMPNFGQQLIEARHRLAEQSTQALADPKEEQIQRFMLGVIVIEEFCKELAAVLASWATTE